MLHLYRHMALPAAYTTISILYIRTIDVTYKGS